jgi:hypothetical protein
MKVPGRSSARVGMRGPSPRAAAGVSGGGAVGVPSAQAVTAKVAAMRIAGVRRLPAMVSSEGEEERKI